MSVPFKTPKDQRYPDFAKRMHQACEGNYEIPAPNEGRLRWFSEKLEAKGHKVALETVRKWFAGMAMPRPKLIVPLAEILKADAGWLAAGTPASRSERHIKAAEVGNGAVYIVAGLIQMDGGNVAFPQPEDRSASDKSTDLHAIIRGAKYDFHIATSVTEKNDSVFTIPVSAAQNIILGVVRGKDFDVRIYELDWAQISSKGSLERGSFVIPFGDTNARAIKSFAERL